MKKLCTAIFLCSFLCLSSFVAMVAHSAVPNEESSSFVFEPKLTETSVFIHSDETPPQEPHMTKTIFLEIKKPTALEERIKALVHGIEMDISPEYDHYGFEIRRLMASVGNPKIYEDREFLREQIVNVRKARVIADFWDKALNKEIEELEFEVEGKTGEISTLLSPLKQRKSEVRSFIVSLRGWINANENLLVLLYSIFGTYDVYYPELVFSKPQGRIDFFNALVLKQAKLKEIKKYVSFSIMIY